MPRRIPLVAAVCLLSALGMAARSAQATTVTVLDHDGRTRLVNNPYLNAAPYQGLPAPAGGIPTSAAAELTAPLSAPSQFPAPLSAATRLPAPLTAARAAAARGRRSSGHAHKVRKPKLVTFAQALAKIERSGALQAVAYQSDLQTWNRALSECKHLTRWRAAQLGGVIATFDEMATDGQVTVARLPVLMLTLQNNASYWRSGPPLADGAPVQFQGSELVWEDYAGSGIQLQVLHTFGEGDGYYEAGPADYPKLATLMAEMVPLAVRRGGGLAWEYYFNWEGGRPPWVSAMAQATGLEALTNAYLATGNRQYLTYAHDALGLLQTPPPAGVAVKTALGTRYLQYSFTPGTDIINAFLQTLLGLYDYAQVSLDPLATTLYNAGNAQAQSELGSFGFGGWSLYQPGEADPLNYHTLVTGFLKLLCQKTQTPAYCTTYQQFEADLLTRPQLTLRTTSAPAGRRFGLRFTLNKYAAVGATLSRGGSNYLYTKRSFFGGAGTLAVPKLKPGLYSLAMSVTDPVGHYARLYTTLDVCRGGCPAPPYAIDPTTGSVPTVTVAVPQPTGTTTTPTGTGTTTTPTGTSTTPTGTATSTTPTGTGTTPTGTGTTTTGGGGTGTTTTGGQPPTGAGGL